MISESIAPKGCIDILIKENGEIKETIHIKNTVLKTGREALAASLANEIGDSYEFYINRMIFGTNGTSGSVPKHVNSDRNGLFGVTAISKAASSNVDPNTPSQVIFTSVLSTDEGNGLTLNEMALRMSNGDLYSMATFPDLNKTSSMQIVFNWRLSFV